MANNKKKYFYPPAPPSGDESFSPNLVGFQINNGGGLNSRELRVYYFYCRKGKQNVRDWCFLKPYFFIGYRC